MKGVINKIIPFSSVDGPGNRTAVFFQGCNINCKYCHNPETRKHCNKCGKCVEYCKTGALSISENGNINYDSKKCVQCDTCIHICPNDSSPRTRQLTPGEVYSEVKKQIPFIRGITVSGGECMLEPEYIQELFQLAKQDRLTTLIDSNGTIAFEKYPDLLAVTDGVMLDIKAFSNQDHEKITDATNQVVLENAKYLGSAGKLYEVRAVIVPDLYNGTESVTQMGEFLLTFLKIKEFRIKLIAFRPMGVRKEYQHFKVPDREYLESLAEVLKKQGFKDIIII